LDGGEARYPPGGVSVFTHMVVHYPKAEHFDDLLASMRRVAVAAQGAAGLVRIGPWRDDRSGRLVGLAIWESREAFEAAAPGIFAVVADDPIMEWSTQPTDIFHLTAG
jgi:hypothetical protein